MKIWGAGNLFVILPVLPTACLPRNAELDSWFPNSLREESRLNRWFVTWQCSSFPRGLLRAKTLASRVVDVHRCDFCFSIFFFPFLRLHSRASWARVSRTVRGSRQPFPPAKLKNEFAEFHQFARCAPPPEPMHKLVGVGSKAAALSCIQSEGFSPCSSFAPLCPT